METGIYLYFMLKEQLTFKLWVILKGVRLQINFHLLKTP